MTELTPRDVVQMLPIEELAALVSGDGVFAFLDDDLGCRFRCTRCAFLSSNGGTARVLDEWSWDCYRCRHRGTVYELQRVVMEDADLLVRAWDHWSEEASDAVT